MIRFTDGPRITAVIIVTALVWCLIGCEAERSSRLESANQAYQRGDFGSALHQSRTIVDQSLAQDSSRKLKGTSADAAYLAGISANRARDPVAAERYLTLASNSSESRIVGDASVELGLLYSEQARHDRAAAAFTRAAENLTGQDRALASHYAGIAYQKLGQWTIANTHFSRALSYSAIDPNFRTRVSQQMGYNAFTVQIGAFESQANAMTEAARYAQRTQSLQLGQPQIMVASHQGRQMYLVWAGRFNSFSGASAAKTRIGAPNGLVIFITVR